VFRKGRQTKRDLVTRYEAKYIIPRSRVPEIRAFIRPFCRPDPYTHGDPPEYTITTLQLDDPYYALHNAKAFEAVNRFSCGADLRRGRLGAGLRGGQGEVEERSSRPAWRSRFDAWNKELVFGVRLPTFSGASGRDRISAVPGTGRGRSGPSPRPLVRYIRESYVGRSTGTRGDVLTATGSIKVTDSWTDFGRSGFWRGMDSADGRGGLPIQAWCWR
jgi:hypothetical protein